MKILATINGQPIPQEPDGCVTFVGEAAVDADGSPRAYGPNNSGFDFTANAGRPGNWWGIVTDKEGLPIVQGPTDPAPGMYVSTTMLILPGYPPTNPRAYLDSETVPFMVVPGVLRRSALGVVIGCRGLITDLRSNASVEVVVGDVGPDYHLGEMSIAAARALLLDADPKHGGCDQRVFQYQFWPDQPAVIIGITYPLQRV